MPTANDAGASNGLQQQWDELYARAEAETSAGTNSSTSGDKPDTSGDSAQATESSLPAPAQTAESPSGQDLPPDPQPSSTAVTTDGSTQETGPSPASQQPSSEAATSETSTTLDQIDEIVGAREMIGLARQAYDNGHYDEALDLLSEADKLDASVAGETQMARQAIAEKIAGK